MVVLAGSAMEPNRESHGTGRDVCVEASCVWCSCGLVDYRREGTMPKIKKKKL